MATSFFEDLSKSFLYKVLGLLASFSVQVIITRYLGIENYGVWNQALSWMQIFLVISLMGNQKQLLRDASSNISQAFGKYFQTVLQVVVTFILCYGAYFLGGVRLGYIDNNNFQIITWLVLIYGVFTVVNKLSTSMLQAVQKNYLTIIINLLTIPVINVLLIAVLLYSIGNNVYVLISFPIASLGAALIFFYYINKFFDKSSDTFAFSSSWNIHFWFNDIAKTLLPYVNIVIISFFLMDSDVGGYSAAYKFSTLLMVFTTIFMSFSPIIVRLVEENKKDKLEQSYLSISKLLLVIVFPILLLIFIFPEMVMQIFGTSFMSYSMVLIVLTVGVYFNAITGPIGEILNMSGFERVEKNINITAALLNIFLIIVLIQAFGILGAAIAYMLPQCIANLSKLYWVNKKMQIKTVKKEHLKILGLQFFIILISILGNSLAFSIGYYIISLLVYFTSITMFRWVRLQDIKQIKNI